MKTLKISDDLHAELTRFVGHMIAESGKTKTYNDAVEALLSLYVVIPREQIREIEQFIAKNRELGYSSKEEFVKEAVCWLFGILGDRDKEAR